MKLKTELRLKFQLVLGVDSIVEDEASMATGVGSIVEVGASVVGCIFSTCDEIIVLVETEN